MLNLNHSIISGISISVPKSIEHNNLSKKEKNYIGVSSKYFDNTNSVKTSDLCLLSAREIIRTLKWDKKDIKYIIFVSQTRDFIFPSTSCILQNKLGLNKDVLAYDIPLGCSGFIYGLFNSFILSEKTKGKGLLLLGDMSSKFVDLNDRQNRILFGDAGTAVAVDFSKRKNSSYFLFGTDGSGSEYIKYDSDQFNKNLGGKFTMKGANVFNYMVKKIPEQINILLNKSKNSSKKIDYYVFHQASKFLIEKISEKLDIKEKKILMSLERFGNTNSASIPVTLFNSKKKIKNSKIVLSGFGVGLSWGSAVINTNKVIFTKLNKL